MAKVLWVVLLVACGNSGGGSPPVMTEPTFCGPNTKLDGTTCVPALACGPGTHEEEGVCVVDPPLTATYDLRAPAMIIANGYGTIDLRLVAIAPDDDAITDQIIFTSDRASAGAIISSRVALGEYGGATTFRPCNSAVDASCIGPVKFTAALASAPTVPIAQVDAMVVAPVPVASIAPCMTGGNVMNFVATDFGQFAQTETVTEGSWYAHGSPSFVAVQLGTTTRSWDININTTPLDMPIVPSVYTDAEANGETIPLRPKFSSGYLPCYALTTFQVHSYTFDASANQVSELTASFSQHCETQPARTLTGCVHFSL